MAAPGWRTDAPLRARLLAEPHRFGFFQAVRLLHAFEPGRRRVGEGGPPADEAVHFAAEPSLAFPASEILDLVDGDDGAPLRMVVRFMGLTGPQGTLPRHYTELVMDRLRRKDRALAEFLDVLNHRLVSLFFRAWQKYRPHLQVTPEADDELSVALFSFFGFATRGMRGRLAVPDRALLYYTGLLAQRPPSAAGLEALLGDWFGDVPVRVEQFVGQWIRLDADSLTRLGVAGGNGQLGVDAVLGSRVWDTQSKFGVHLGPMGWQRLASLLPTGAASREAVDLTQLYVGRGLDFDLRLRVRAAEVRPTTLGSTGPDATRLGWSSWLGAAPRRADADDVAFTAETLAAHHSATMEDSP